MLRQAQVLCAVIGALVFGVARGQSEIVHARAPDARPSEPLRIFGLRLPFKTGPISSGAELTIDYHLGNTWNPTAALQFPDGSPKSSMANKVYGAAGVFRSANIRFVKRLGSDDEVDVALSLFKLVKGNALLDAPASNRTIEAFHSLLGQDDPYQRRRNGLDRRAFVFMQDARGATAEVHSGRLLWGTLDVGRTRYFDIVESDHFRLTVPLGVFVAVPLNGFSPYFAVGALVGATGTVAISMLSSLTFGLEATVQDDHALKIGSATQFLDRPVSAGYRMLLAYNGDSLGGGRVSVGLELQGMTSPLSGHQESALVDPESLGLQSGFVSGTDLNHTFRTMVFGSEYVAAFVSWKGSRGEKTPEVTFYVQEDWRILTGPQFGSGFGGSDNAQDWGLGLKLRLPL